MQRLNSIETHLSTLPSPYKEKALRAYKEAPLRPLSNVLNTRTALLLGINWENTQEGKEFWAKVYEALKEGKQLQNIEQ